MAGLGLAGLPIHSRSPQPPSFQGQQQQQQLVQMQPLQMQQMPAQVAAPPQPVALDAAAIMIKLASIAGEKFKDMFYNVFDAHRSDLHRLFHGASVLVWDGTAVQGVNDCAALFQLLPSSKHTVETFDVQPITGGEMRGMINSLLVNVTGTVVWGNSASGVAPSGFYHSFVLERSAGPSRDGKFVHHVVSASMRTRQLDEAGADAGGASHQTGNRKRRNFK